MYNVFLHFLLLDAYIHSLNQMFYESIFHSFCTVSSFLVKKLWSCFFFASLPRMSKFAWLIGFNEKSLKKAPENDLNKLSETLVTSVGGFRIENIKFTLVTFSPYFI